MAAGAAEKKPSGPSSGKNKAAAVNASKLRYTAMSAMEKHHPGHEPGASPVEKADLRKLQADLRKLQAEQAAGKFH